MSSIEIANILDDLHDANSMLEVCRGYTQADAPDMKALDVALWSMEKTYDRIYNSLSAVEKGRK